MRKQKRPYVKAARTESEAETRDRIVHAIVALHEEVGPRRTTVSAIAHRAGVQRLTVYRHFPDEDQMIAACSACWTGEHPLPDLASASGIADPRRRARTLLTALYRYYRSGERMLTNIFADAPHMRAVAENISPMSSWLDGLVAELERCWRGRSSRRTATLRHAVQFETWRSLGALTSDDSEAVKLVMRWCSGA